MPKMAFYSKHWRDGTEQPTLWKWTEFGGRKWDCTKCFFKSFAFLSARMSASRLICFLKADGQRMYFHPVLSLSTCKESKDKLCYSDVLMFGPLYVCFMQTVLLCRAQIFNLHLVIPIDHVVFCYLLLIVTTLTIVKRCNISFYFPRLN